MDNIVVYVLSDSIGETGEMLSRAALSQFDTNAEIRKFPYITSKDQVIDIIKEAANESSIILFTIVLEDLKTFIVELSDEMNIPSVDLMTPAMNAIAEVVNKEPKRESGLIRKLDENYFRKIEAVEFAVKYDDGKDSRGIRKADIVLIGISRTSKTPLSMYLAHKNYKVANIPLVPEVDPPAELFKKDKKKLIGLVSHPDKINEIRQERLKALGLNDGANYADLKRIQEELEYSRKIMEELGCYVIDVSNKAIEETAGIIIDKIREDI